MNYSLQHIQQQFNSKKRLKYLFFWGHQPSADRSVAKSCFSQWWKSAFTVENETYKTAEHWMMAEKARLFNDEESRQKILVVNHPDHVKKLGRQVKNFNSKVWDEKKYEIVVEGNYHKFSQNEGLKQFLLKTKKRILVEASPVDRIWGIGLHQDNDKAMNPNLWKGQNLLGFALMEARDRLSKTNNNE